MVTYDIIKEKLLDYHLLTGEALGSRQLHSHSTEGTWDFRVGTTQRPLGVRRSRGAAPDKNAQCRSASLLATGVLTNSQIM